MDDGSITLLAALIILVAFSAFFSASETAFSSLNQIRLKSRAEDGDTSAARVLAMAEKYDKLLSTILIGNNIVNIAAASIGTIIFTKMLGAERGATVSTMVLTVVVLIFGEVTPKGLAKEMPETVATAVAPALSLLMLVFTPLTWLFSQWKRFLGHFVHSTEEDTITEGELMTMVSEAENDGELTDRESELIRSAIEFDDVEVEEILTPRVDVIAVEDDMPLEEVAQTFAESGYSRLPVYHDTIDNIIGVVHEKDFYLARLKKAATVEDLIAPTLYTTGSTQISQLLRTLREQLAQDKADLEQQQAELTASKTELDAQVAEATRVFEEYAASEAGQQALLNQQAAREKELQEEIRKSEEASRKDQTAVGGFIWPTACRLITGGYGGRDAPCPGASTYHLGVDIGASWGSDIYATKAGTVMLANEGWNYGLGYCVKIQHDDGTSTVYGHMSRVIAVAGQRVAQGQVIGKIGSTGVSTGPHLHYEIRIGGVNGTAINPLPYLPGYIRYGW